MDCDTLVFSFWFFSHLGNGIVDFEEVEFEVIDADQVQEVGR